MNKLPLFIKKFLFMLQNKKYVAPEKEFIIEEGAGHAYWPLVQASVDKDK